MVYKRIAIIGQSASGKTSLAKRIGKETGLPVFHVDKYLWDNNWDSVPESIYLFKHRSVVSSSKWVIDGYINEHMSERLEKSDLIVYLDYSAIICSWRFLKRWVRRLRCKDDGYSAEYFGRLLVKLFVEPFRNSERKAIESLLQNISSNKIIKFSSQKRLNQYLYQNRGVLSRVLRQVF